MATDFDHQDESVASQEGIVVQWEYAESWVKSVKHANDKIAFKQVVLKTLNNFNGESHFEKKKV